MRLKYYLLPFLLIAVVFADSRPDKCKDKGDSHSFLRHIDIDLDHGTLVLVCDHDDYNWVEITPDAELYINGESIDLTSHQKYLLSDYYDNFMDFLNQSKEIGIEGAKIGLHGVKVGLLALEGLLKVALTDYQSDEFEEEIEDEGDRLKDKADELEEMAEELEESADELEDLHHQLKRNIFELNHLSWF